jgi:quercetin 2,3-dioxygenase
MVIAFSPAGAMEAFFEEASDLQGMGSPQEMSALFARHDMTIVGPPLAVEPS